MARTRGGTTGSRRRGRCVALAAGLVLVLGACSTPQAPTPTPSLPDDVALEVTTVSGDQGLSADERARVEGRVGEVLSRYLAEGFLGDYPRQRFVQAFDDFTPVAAELAAGDIGVLTASELGQATSVSPKRLDARLSLLVRDGSVLGATAYVDAELEATLDGETRRVTLAGRLMLQQQGGRWTVFGFDLAGDDGAPLGGGRR